jgi:hypothetical protein
MDAAAPRMAELKNLVDESALLAGRRGHGRDSGVDLSDALDKSPWHGTRDHPLPGGAEAHHLPDSGHALLGMLSLGTAEQIIYGDITTARKATWIRSATQPSRWWAGVIVRRAFAHRPTSRRPRQAARRCPRG